MSVFEALKKFLRQIGLPSDILLPTNRPDWVVSGGGRAKIRIASFIVLFLSLSVLGIISGKETFQAFSSGFEALPELDSCRRIVLPRFTPEIEITSHSEREGEGVYINTREFESARNSENMEVIFPGKSAEINVLTANVRESPVISSRKVGTAKLGMVGIVVDRKYEWTRLKFSKTGLSGWVRNDLLKFPLN